MPSKLWEPKPRGGASLAGGDQHPYHIKDALLQPAVHHQSFQKLWETKWKAPVRLYFQAE